MKKTSVVIIGTKRCAEKFAMNVSLYGKNTVISKKISLENLPVILDDLCGALPKSTLKPLLEADIILDCTGHPDIPHALSNLRGNARKIITTSVCDLSGVVSVDCLCSTDISCEFGIPEFRITTRNGRIKEIDVVKSSPCGAAYYLAENLEGMQIKEAITKSGLLTQFICKGKGGPESTIHRAAGIHKKAVERAVSAGVCPNSLS